MAQCTRFPLEIIPFNGTKGEHLIYGQSHPMLAKHAVHAACSTAYYAAVAVRHETSL